MKPRKRKNGKIFTQLIESSSLMKTWQVIMNTPPHICIVIGCASYNLKLTLLSDVMETLSKKSGERQSKLHENSSCYHYCFRETVKINNSNTLEMTNYIA